MSGWIGWLAVAAGGAVGAVLRALFYHLLERLAPRGSRGGLLRLGPGSATLLVNLIGSFALGLLLSADAGGAGAGHDALSAAGVATTGTDWPRFFWTTGVCGALTTFSTFCAEAIGLAQQAEPVRLILYLGASGGLCLAAFAAGTRLAA